MDDERIQIVPGEITTRDLHQFLLASVSPRPIAFVSTLGENGVANLAPYSFFNVFSSNPPILVFSSNRRVKNNTTKDTLANVKNQQELVINVVNHDIVRQMAVSSVEFPSDVSEFDETGLHPLSSVDVRAPRIAESPVNMECKVNDIISLGKHGGAGHLIICELLRMHIRKDVIGENGRIDPHKIDLMGRLGRAYYVRVKGDAIQTIVQAVTKPVIGYSALAEHIRTSEILSGNDIGMLAGCHTMPSHDAIQLARAKHEKINGQKEKIHQEAKDLLRRDLRDQALALLMTL